MRNVLINVLLVIAACYACLLCTREAIGIAVDCRTEAIEGTDMWYALQDPEGNGDPAPVR
jgi:hypothetical protein